MTTEILFMLLLMGVALAAFVKEIFPIEVTALGLDGPVLVAGDPEATWGDDGYTYWMVRVAGFDDVAVLNGGVPAWQRAGGQLEAGEPTERAPVEPPNPERPGWIATTADVPISVEPTSR